MDPSNGSANQADDSATTSSCLAVYHLSTANHCLARLLPSSSCLARLLPSSSASTGVLAGRLRRSWRREAKWPSNLALAPTATAETRAWLSSAQTAH